MTMKSSPGSISPPAEYRDQLQIGPRTRVFGDGASGSSFWKIMAAPSVLGQKGFYRRRRGPRRCPGGRGGPHPRVQGGPRQAPACGPWVPPQVALRSSGVFRRIKNLRKFLGHSDGISCCDFSEIQKQQKQGTGTGHLVNRLVRQNA